MKKAILLLLTLGSFAGAFAQQRSFQQNDNRNSSYQTRSSRQPPYGSRSGNVYTQPSQPQYGNRSNSSVYVQHNQSSANYGNRMSERQRQAEMARINSDYDRRINIYRNNRSLSSYERNNRINGLQQERNNQLKTIGGALLGAVLGGIIGSAL
ncbi:MAG: hypothetical protein JWN76_3782 [Chitinophagaceae bacterium]|nr:hypothetical protein [Chitinophagaceae bacterium]